MQIYRLSSCRTVAVAKVIRHIGGQIIIPVWDTGYHFPLREPFTSRTTTDGENLRQIQVDLPRTSLNGTARDGTASDATHSLHLVSKASSQWICSRDEWPINSTLSHMLTAIHYWWCFKMWCSSFGFDYSGKLLYESTMSVSLSLFCMIIITSSVSNMITILFPYPLSISYFIWSEHTITIFHQRITNIHAYQSNVEADAYWCITKLLDNIQDHYTFGQPGLQRMTLRLEDLIHRLDNELYQHFQSQGVMFQFFTTRWMNCVLMRELPLRSIIRLWDTYLSEDQGGFENFHVYVCAVLLRTFRNRLVTMEFQDIILFLQSLPTVEWDEEEVEPILSQAFILSTLFDNSPNHLSWASCYRYISGICYIALVYAFIITVTVSQSPVLNNGLLKSKKI